MRNLVYLAAVASLAGCLSEAKYNQKYAEKYCEEWAACGVATECPIDSTGTSAEDDGSCDFDRKAANDCLKGEWTCSDGLEGYNFPETPAACDNVCGGGGGGTTPEDTGSAG
ncbi:MAG: hypothetical protein H6738_14145 [Alphaproteobacteria bacterium]|nr:hypothetical protein [Alphaproteobacteria bacterium]MCB9697916.1 hypothetical protein [Alphaproteobacteria bacterium]